MVPGEAADQHRQQVVAPAGVDAADEQRGPALLAGGQQRLDQLAGRAAVVVERVDRRRDHGGAAREAAPDVGHRVVGAQLSRGHVGHRAAAVERAERRVDVGRGEHAEVAAEAGQVTGVAPDLLRARDHHPAQPQARVRVDRPDGGPAHVPRAPHHHGVERVLVLHVPSVSATCVLGIVPDEIGVERADPPRHRQGLPRARAGSGLDLAVRRGVCQDSQVAPAGCRGAAHLDY